ncbi:hypothetical protein T440DRAFT_430418 [Plenodomus tracheiphilus IPT5]|uniref:Mucin-like protein n=1 Tax=Plenodomus tracheiphilus IPT5 TaxID=1408161 RepID=A0A6A7AWZ9_9PLEO|nr:hypothetical protein T440DRAFT_430418 [Plenodomus tracheiphilus IPT5]
MKSRARGPRLPLTQAEFDALPYSVQRKYFSSLERLQIQRQAADEPAPTSGRSSRASSSTPFRPPLPVTLSTRRRRRTPATLVNTHARHAAAASPAVSPAQVDFFLSLPEKVRKLQFSREEQLLFQARHCQQAFLPDEHEVERAQQRFDDFRFDFTHTPGCPPATPRGRPRRRLSSASSTASPSPKPSRTSFYLPIEKQRDHHRISSLPHFDMMNTPSSTTKESSPPFRRTMSLTAASFRHPASPTMFLADPPPPYAIGPNPRHQRAHSSSLSLSGRRSSQTPTPPIFDPEATHYQDPEARKKLRMYLASPQKFDEAIEFGFPSTADTDALTPHYQLPQIDSHARKFSRDMHTFLRDGKLSFLEDGTTPDNQGLESSDAGSVADMESPTTPSSTGLSFRLHSRQTSHGKFSIESPMASPAHSGTGQMNREMTLRMTLTRPDLRADEDQLYGWQGSSSPKSVVKDDPLALEDLVFTDDTTGAKGAFYVKPKARGNLVSRILKRASLKTAR